MSRALRSVGQDLLCLAALALMTGWGVAVALIELQVSEIVNLKEEGP